MADDDFTARRMAARKRLDELEGAMGGDPDRRNSWFHDVYATAGNDPAGVPWADLAPKTELLDWLKSHPGEGRRALDIACGLGDNAEALAEFGYRTTAFDLVPEAVAWAASRFTESKVRYQTADLFSAPEEWSRAFDLVHECYTVQALFGDQRLRAIETIANFVAPDGRLLVITRTQSDEAATDGPPWPLKPSELSAFEAQGLSVEDRLDYAPERADGRIIPHVRIAFRRLG